MVRDYFNGFILRLRYTKNSYNEIQSVDQSTIACRIEPSEKLVNNISGEQVKANWFLIFTGSADIQLTDKIKINGYEFPILSIIDEYGINKKHHKEVYL